MEPVSTCCEHIHISLMQVPGLLSQQLLSTSKAPVIVEHAFPGRRTIFVLHGAPLPQGLITSQGLFEPTAAQHK